MVTALRYTAAQSRDGAFQIGAVPGATSIEVLLAPLGERPVRVTVMRTSGALTAEDLEDFFEPFDLWARGGPEPPAEDR
jgi:hypothetical protein